ncbi:MAG TPA: cell division protein FtsQ/DivIB [Kiloniellales bacterium]|nr:cell division protein FtsQ/DivIB [Kiloniellales bacterium]
MRLKRRNTPSQSSRRRSPPRRRWSDSRLLRGILPLLPRLLLVAVVAGSVAWVWRAGVIANLAGEAEASFWAASVHAGLAVRDVTVEGRVRGEPESLLAALGVERGDPILAFDPHAARERVMALPWIASAEVQRRLPDQIHLRLEERNPIALWQHQGRLAVIDQHGQPITNTRPGRFINLPLVVGEGAPAQARNLVALLEREPDMAKRVVAAVWVSDRRWNLRLEGGVEVRLPEFGAEEAWSQLAELERQQGVLDRDVAMIDMRLPDRLVLRSVTGRLPTPPSRSGTDT